jgi:hypothetical protein
LKGIKMKCLPSAGPWVACRNSHFWEVRQVGAVNAIADTCASDPENADSGIQEANAKLIAAAPEMFEALWKVRHVLANLLPGGPMLDLINEALDKAQGNEIPY